jgi:hypothetical protein
VRLLGLGFDIAGAIILSVGLFLTEREAIDLGRDSMGGGHG